MTLAAATAMEAAGGQAELTAQEKALAAVTVMAELADLTPKINHEQFRAAAAQAALDGLLVCEQQAQRSLALLVSVLHDAQGGPDLARDAAWALSKLTRKCLAARRWALNAGGLAAARRALVAYPDHEQLAQSVIWVVYSLDGLHGLAVLLRAPGDGSCTARLPDSAAAAVAWAVYELTRESRGAGLGASSAVGGAASGTRLTPEAGDLLRLLVEVMALRSRALEVQWACYSALDALIQKEPRLSALFLDCGGAPLLLDVLRGATDLPNGSGAELAKACCYTLASIAEGSAAQAHVLIQHGAAEALARLSVRGCGSVDEEAGIWALGTLAGLGTVLDALARAPKARAVVRGGVQAISALAEQASATPADVARLPEALNYLLGLLVDAGGAAEIVESWRLCSCVGAVACALAPHAGPGQLPELDRAVDVLFKGLRAFIPTDSRAANHAVESLGRLALISPAWREGLRFCGAADMLAALIHGTECRDDRQLLKYCFWAAAALSGMPLVIRELRLQLGFSDIVDAALCTIIDILDDDLEGEWVLKDAERCSKADIPPLMSLIVEAMRNHMGLPNLQGRGCHCINLLVALASGGTGAGKSGGVPLPEAAATAIVTAARRHPRSTGAVRSAMGAFRGILLESGMESLVNVLRQEDAAAIASQALADFAEANDTELLEDAVVVVCALSGIEPVLAKLRDAGPGTVRTVGVKALFEFGRLRLPVLQACAAQVAAAVSAMVGQNPADDALAQHAALLAGICNHVGGCAIGSPQGSNGCHVPPGSAAPVQGGA